MSEEELFSRSVLLCNGARVLMEEVVSTLLLLDKWASTSEGQLRLFHLREACLDRSPISDERRSQMRDAKLIWDDGSINPSVKFIVLAAVRGEGQALAVTSPFTTSLDKTVAEMFITREKIQESLGGPAAELLLVAPGLGETNTLEELSSWAEFIKKDQAEKTARPTIPPPSRN